MQTTGGVIGDLYEISSSRDRHICLTLGLSLTGPDNVFLGTHQANTGATICVDGVKQRKYPCLDVGKETFSKGRDLCGIERKGANVAALMRRY